MPKRNYELTDETIEIDDNGVKRTLHRIRAIRNFKSNRCSIKCGDVGGFIENFGNLIDNAWIYDDACVYGDAVVGGTARIYNKARVYDYAHVLDSAVVADDACVYDYVVVSGEAFVGEHAKVCGKSRIGYGSRIYGNAYVSGLSYVFDQAEIYDNAHVSGYAYVGGYADIYGNANVSGHASILERAVVHGNAIVFGFADICGMADVFGDAVVCEECCVKCKTSCVTNISTDIVESVRVQTGLIPINGEVIAYKQVKNDLTSFYDSGFKYEVGAWAVAEDAEESNSSCASGLHFSNANYWNQEENVLNSTFLIAKIKIEDIITVQDGKIRCRKAFILGTYNIGENN